MGRELCTISFDFIAPWKYREELLPPKKIPLNNDTKDEDTLDDNISTGNEIEKRHRQTE